MCIICHKESGIKLPEMNILEACFKSNRHGAGILLWRHNSPTAEIHKGYMSFSDFKDAFEHLDIKMKIMSYFTLGSQQLAVLTKKIVIHFRFHKKSKTLNN